MVSTVVHHRNTGTFHNNDEFRFEDGLTPRCGIREADGSQTVFAEGPGYRYTGIRPPQRGSMLG
jgi:hypothetical protein